ncbi:MAG: succinate dehydrogenase, hydrophobic membrane anchor protein [Gammaproteobacteria bacterium]|nr:succinate dehydrogenase, hydrophobic membrane anchor protein [Gammaproteobacteria bacterium]MBU1725273.1 succinate dehydrogenase, hydrophobic membrane anchor protein [Gammaproteobacteria bacterium]MBU2006777.1 succinate dehydrogenase, hydrophobic membrane anchor protein [Gammaproteobacteria bacterium]
MRFETPTKRAHGLGPVKTGVHHWWAQRITSIALIPLTLWVVFSVASLAGEDYASVAAWFARPLTGVILSLFVFVATYHASLGLQVVIEDYVHHQPARIAALITVKFLLILLGTLSIVSILRLFFSA